MTDIKKEKRMPVRAERINCAGRAARLLCVMLAVLTALSLAACGGDGAAGDSGEKIVHTGKKVNSPAGIKYLTKNKLDAETININRDGSERTEKYPAPYEYDRMSASEKAKYDKEELYFSGYYVQISGLKDKEIETAVNDKLKALCMDNLNKIPPYRGIKAEIGEDPQPCAGDSYSSAYQSVTFNDNNILAVMMYVSTSYESKTQHNTYGTRVSFAETLNIDLTTGNEIALADIFCNDVDALGYVNDCISKEISSSSGDEEVWDIGGDIKIAAPFTGISADQKYSINESGISIMLDYATPEFDTGFEEKYVTIPFSDEMAVSERFFDEDENIFESEEEPEKHFAYTEYDALDRETIIDEDKNMEGNDNFWIFRRATCPKGVPKYINERLTDFAGIPEDELLSEIESYIPEDADRSKIHANYYFSAYASEMGPFVNTYNSLNKIVYDEGYDTVTGNGRYYYEDRIIRETYDTRKKSNEPIELHDIFAENADYETIIKHALVKKINKGIDDKNSTKEWDIMTLPEFKTGDGSDAEKLNTEYIDKLYDNIIYFSVDYDGISFGFENSTSEIYEEVYGRDPYNTYGGYIYVNSVDFVDYGLVGCSNLNIFDF